MKKNIQAGVGALKNTCYTPNRDVKGKPSERMGHKAIGPYPGKQLRTGSQLSYRNFLDLFFVPFTGSRFFNFKIGPIIQGGSMNTRKLVLSVLAAIGVCTFCANNAHATTWYVRNGGGTSAQCTGTTNAVYPGSGSAQPCAFNHPAWVLGAPGGSAKMAAGDTLYIVGDSDNTWNFTVPGVSILPAIGDEYTSNGVTYTVTVSLPLGFTSGQITMTGSAVPPTSGTFTVVSGHGSGTSPITYTARSVAQAQYMIGYGMPNNTCSTSSASSCAMSTVPAGTSSTVLTHILGLEGADGLMPQLWGTEGVQQILDLTGGGNYDVENLEITQHSSCNGVVLTYGLTGIYPAGCGDQTGTGNGLRNTYPYGPSVAASTWAFYGLTMIGTNFTTKNLWVHNIGFDSIDFEGNVSNWNSTNDRFIAAGASLTQNINGTMSFGGTNSLTNDIWAFGGCMEKYPLPDPGNMKDLNNYINCADQGYSAAYGGYALGGGFMMQNGTNGACGNWNIIDSQFLFNLKTNQDFLHCNGTGQVNVYRSRYEGSTGEAFKVSVAGVNLEESQFIANAPVWETPQFQALKAPNDGSSGWDFEICRGDANTIFVSSANEQINYINDDLFSNCTSNIAIVSEFSFGNCSGNGLNVYNTKIINGYAYDDPGSPTVSAGSACGGGDAAPFTVSEYNDIYNDRHSAANGYTNVCVAANHNLCEVDPKVLAEAAPNSFSTMFGCTPENCMGQTSYYSGTSLGDLFYPQSSSPLLGKGTSSVSYTNGSSNDYNNMPADSPVDIGAIQNNSCIANATGATNGFCSINAQCCGGTCNSEGQCVANGPKPQPVVAITSPANASSFSSGTNVTITATASETNGTITNIAIYNGTTLLGQSSASPYNYVMTNAAAGTYTLTAVATDANGVSKTSSLTTVTVTTQSILPSPPVVTITSPANGSSYTSGSNVTITTTASETNGTISKIALYNGSGLLLGSSSTSPYNFVDSNMAGGGYSFFAVATDVNGVSTTSSTITITVTAPSVPVVSITSPLNGSTFIRGSTFNVTATASETNGTIAQVSFYNGTTLMQTVTTPPYTISWSNSSMNSYTLTAVATDAKGVSTTSGVVATTLATPAVAITSPANGSNLTAGSNVSVTASATETGGSIAQVQFYNGATLLGAVSTSPYSYNWTNVPAGSYALTAQATDAHGISTTSNAVTVTVSTLAVAPGITAQPSSVTITAPATATFSIVATGTPAPTYQWMQSVNGGVFANINGATSSSYTTPATTTANSGTKYECKVSNASGFVTSNAATLTVNPTQVAPSITTQPVSMTVTAPAPATFTLAATGVPAPTYQWKEEASGATSYTAISSATSASYTTSATTTANSGTKYECVATNASGSVTSTAVTLTVNSKAAPVVAITSPINGGTFLRGATFNITAAASEANGTIAQVSFYNGTTLMATVTKSPYTISWTNSSFNIYALTAVATDTKGVSTTSGLVTITLAT